MYGPDATGQVDSDRIAVTDKDRMVPRPAFDRRASNHRLSAAPDGIELSILSIDQPYARTTVDANTLVVSPFHQAANAPAPPGESIANTAWWELFDDPLLIDLIEETLENNRNLRTSVARIREARASLGDAHRVSPQLLERLRSLGYVR